MKSTTKAFISSAITIATFIVAYFVPVWWVAFVAAFVALAAATVALKTYNGTEGKFTAYSCATVNTVLTIVSFVIAGVRALSLVIGM